MKNHRYISFSPISPEIESIACNILFIYKTAKYNPVKTNILEKRGIFVHCTIVDHAL